MEQLHRRSKGNWIEIPDAVEKPSPLLSAIALMEPVEVLALWHGVHMHDRTVEERPTPTPEAEGYWSDEYSAIGDVADKLDYALWQLPQRDIEHARELYVSFADSSLDNDREWAAYLINAITPQDHDFGLALWDRLMRDPSELVRTQARRTLSEHIDDEEFAEQGLALLGITRLEASQLLDAYARAQAGAGIHDLGRAALGHVLIPSYPKSNKPDPEMPINITIIY